MKIGIILSQKTLIDINDLSYEMCCCLCGYISSVDEKYKIIEADDEEDDYPVCPKCKKWNIGGYSSYAPANIWDEETLERIVELNEI